MGAPKQVPATTFNPYWTLMGGFMPNALMESAAISPNAKVCYIALASFSNRDQKPCWPSQETLAARYGSSERRTRVHLEELEKAGFIRITQTGKTQSNVYEFLTVSDLPNLSVTTQSDRTKVTGHDRTKVTGHPPSYPLTEPHSLEPHSYKKPCPAEFTPQKDKHTPAAEEEKDLVGSAPGPSAVPTYIYLDVDVDTPILIWVKREYRGSKYKLQNLDSKQNHSTAEEIAAKEADCGALEFRASLSVYLEREDPWLIEQKYPINHFLNNYQRYAVDTSRLRTKPLSDDSPNGSGQSPSADGGTNDPAPPVRDYAAIWETILPGKPTGRLSKLTRIGLAGASTEPDFTERFEEICTKCKAMVDAVNFDLNFAWLFIVPKSGIVNWAALLEGKYNWALRSRTETGQELSPAQKVLAKMRAEEAEKKKSKGEHK